MTVAIAVGRGEFHGISAFSSTNFGWLAFILVGGVVYGWRRADGRALPWAPLRPLLAGALSFIICVVAVCLTGLLFLPEQPVLTTLMTDAVGRARPVALLVVIVGYFAELVAWVRCTSNMVGPAWLTRWGPLRRERG
ncbi:MAG: hypothetical protein L0I76_02550 [Pseudonocardia sp.]|nr:hypothetical protein [Pseudonocardia sp.]